MVKAQKYDTGKNRLELIPPEFLYACGKALTYGAKKYEVGNWTKGEGLEWSRIYGALQRHLNSFWNGEEIDEESGNKHLENACAMLAFLVASSERQKGIDDRYTIGVSTLPREASRSRNPNGKQRSRKSTNVSKVRKLNRRTMR